jgi:fibronectin-binding autotransporter adhesin
VAVPAVVAVGAVSNVTTAACTPGIPTGTAAGDLLLVFIESANEPINATAGWSNVGVGVVQQATGLVTSITVRWKIAGAGEVSPSLTSTPQNHMIARIVGVRGANQTSPINITATGVDNTTGTAFSIPGATTTVADCLVVAALATGTDVASTTMTTGWTNASLATLTERVDNWAASGNGGGIAVATGSKATAGAYSATTGTLTTGNTKAFMSFAVAPATTVAFSGTATLTATGTLGAAATPSVPVGVALSGDGALTVAGQPVQLVPLTGTGSLTAGGTPAAGGGAALTGAGVLSFAVTITVSRAVTLTGAGTLAPAGGPAVAGPVALSSTGTLTPAGQPRPAGLLGLTAAGVLALAVTATPAGAVTLTTTGTLASVATPSLVVPVALAATGALTVLRGAVAGAAAFTAGGVLTLTATPTAAGGLTSTALGTLTLAGAARAGTVVTLAGVGSLLAAALPSVLAAPALTGSGQLVVFGTANTGTGAWWMVRRRAAGKTTRPDTGRTEKR